MLRVGDPLPEFSLERENGEVVTTASLRGRPVVLFAYPRADTPGCTKEACAFRDLAAEFAALGVQVYGISGDTVKKQASFNSKYGLGLPLLADTQQTLLEACGVIGEKKMYGKVSRGIIRSTLLFGADGLLVRLWSPVKVDGHADEVLDAARAMGATQG